MSVYGIVGLVRRGAVVTMNSLSAAKAHWGASVWRSYRRS